MRFLRSVIARIAGMFTKHSADAELREEMQAHLEMATAENVRRGMSPEEARRQALMASGGMTQAEEAVHDQAGLPWLESIAADIKYGLRALRHAPGFTAVVAITLALGIGANTAIFSVVRGVLLKPLPNRDGERLVYLRHSQQGQGGEDILFSVPEVRDLRSNTRSLSGVAEYDPYSVIYQSNEGSTRWQVALVTGNYFDVVGLSPVRGRLTLPTDDGQGAAPVAVLTYETWVNKFGADSTLIGKYLQLDSRPVQVIGVLQPSPFFPDKVDALLNMVNSSHHVGAQMQTNRSHRMTSVLARIKPTVTVAQARSDIEGVYAQMRTANPAAYDAAAHYRVEVIPFREALGERASFTLWLLMGAAALVLIITVANVANLTLMRGVRREHELVVRSAMGAGTLRLRRLLMVENLLLALFGAALGVALAVGGVRLLTSFAQRFSSRASEISLDGVVLSFTVGLAVVVAILLSFLGWTPVEGRLATWIAAGARRMTASLRRQRLQRGLVVAQVAFSVVLLAGAGLLTRTLIRLSNVNTGLKTDQVLTMNLWLTSRTQSNNDTVIMAAARQRFDETRREIAALPGVIDVGLGTLPLRRAGNFMDVDAEGRQVPPGQARPRADWRYADAHYFDAAGIPIIAGRNFTAADEPIEDSVVIVNKTFADRVFPGENAVGHRMMFTSQVLRELYPQALHWRTIVGVVGDTRDGELDAKTEPAVFSASLETPLNGGLAIRADGNVANLIPAVTKVVRRISPTALIEQMMTIQQYKSTSVSSKRLNATLISSFAMLALLIAAVGIGGVLAFSVSARVNEIGIRMSLGADPGTVERMILWEGSVLVITGLVLGVTGALVAGRIIQGMLYGIAPNDPTTLLSAAAIMAVSGIAACWIPALRAARVDPAITMRAQ